MNGQMSHEGAEEHAFAGAGVIGGASPDPGNAVADALSVIDGLESLPPAEHTARFEHVHDVLRAHLNGDT